MRLEERAQAIPETEASRFARKLYGLEVTAKALPGEYDDNFLLTTVGEPSPQFSSPEAVNQSPGAPSFVLKVMHPAREPSFIDLQCRALEHLQQRAPQLGLPSVSPQQDGQNWAAVQGADGSERLVWMLTYVPGTLLPEARPHSRELLASLGQFLGEMDAALADFTHPAAHRELKWDLASPGWIRQHLDQIRDASRRALVEKFWARFEAEVVPVAGRLRRSIIHGDANDYNVLVGPPLPAPRKVVGVIDFGDLHHTLTVAEVAISAAYAILDKEEPLQAATAVVGGYHSVFALQEQELAILYTLIGTRLAVSVTNSAIRGAVTPGDPYVAVSEAPAWDALRRLADIHPRFAHYAFREACRLPPVTKSESAKKWIAANAGAAASLLDVDLRTAPSITFDLSVGSAFLGADPSELQTDTLSEKIFRALKKAHIAVGIGRYDEARLYTAPQFATSHAASKADNNPTDERRTIHLGIDLFAGPGSAIYAPLDGVVHTLANNAAPQDYGPLVILRHENRDGLEFFTLYGHLTKTTVSQLRLGQRIVRGEKFARIGAVQENGGWPPHLHFQIILDLLERDADFPGVARASERGVWTSLSPDPNLLLRIPAEHIPPTEAEPGATLAGRREFLGPNLSLSYHHPLKIVRGWMQYLYDETGRAFLDVYNNVPLVGHSHPRVVRAAQAQLALLNTNTRYLHDHAVHYAERLTRLLPDPLRVCYFVNSGSEANELALRMARAHTGREDVIVLEHAYHGHTSTLIDISPYKFDGPGGQGRKPWVHVAPIPDDYRGPHRRGEPNLGVKYAQYVGEILNRARGKGCGIAAFIADTLPSAAGQIVFPQDYLKEVYRVVREAGGVCIADEVQVGFGRLGTHFWGFETQGVVPDIVVFGKPIGNAFPLAAVVTSREIAASFANGMEFFSTFGGNPVACAAGMAVLDVLEEERLQQRALRVGKHWMDALTDLQKRHALIGDVRGSGLFLGIDLVRDPYSRAHATEEADYVVKRLRERGILAGTDGPGHNVIKLRPPLIFSEADADLFAETLDAILREDAAQPIAKSRPLTSATTG